MLLPTSWNVPGIFRDRLGDRAGRQRTMIADGHLLLVLHKVPRPETSDRDGVLFWRNADGQWASTGVVGGLGGLRAHIEEFAAAIERLEVAYENANDASSYFLVLQAITPLHRSAAHLHAALQAAREGIPDDRDLIVLRDRAGDLERAAELVYTDATHALSYSMAKRSEELARSNHALAAAGHRLNVLAAFFLPISAIAAVFSMQLSSGIEHCTPGMFWIVLGAAVLIGLILCAALRFAVPGAAQDREAPKAIGRPISRTRMAEHPRRSPAFA